MQTRLTKIIGISALISHRQHTHTHTHTHTLRVNSSANIIVKDITRKRKGHVPRPQVPDGNLRTLDLMLALQTRDLPDMITTKLSSYV